MQAAKPPVHYQTKLVLFFDVLGWRNLVDAAGCDPEKIGRLNWAATILSIPKGHDATGQHVISSFSDHVLLSVPLELDRLGEHLESIARIQLGLLVEDFPIRGALTIGNIHHTEHAVFGPALIRAYDLETKMAGYPRILLDPACEVLSTFEHPVIAEADGLRWVNPFHPGFLNNLPQSAPAPDEIFEKYTAATGMPIAHVSVNKSQLPLLRLIVHAKLQALLDEAPGDKEKGKIGWLINQFNQHWPN